jgi:aryl-alcohol dehydrogenase-like predicted oxidoreductase
MKTVELYPGISSSALGFGCASALGSVDRATALRALAIAFDQGITHFDIARSYGYGEAEQLLGDFARGKRDRMVIATKFGIEATPLARALRPLKSAARAVIKRRKRGGAQASNTAAASAPTAAPKVADAFHRRLAITPENMIRSLETSLRALRTDYVDYLFVHEPQAVLKQPEELLAAIEKLKQQGKIRACGLAFLFSQWQMHQSYLGRFDVLQFDNSPCAAHYQEAMGRRQDQPNIFFSPFRHSLASGEGDRLSPQQILHRLQVDFPLSVVLCSMYKEEHILQNVGAFS